LEAAHKWHKTKRQKGLVTASKYCPAPHKMPAKPFMNIMDPYATIIAKKKS
jgi:hypothetical protein